MIAPPQKVWTAEAYLAMERASEERHELVDGRVRLRVGASQNHNLITVNTLTSLNLQLKGRACEVYAVAMRVLVGQDFVYPDVVVVCGEPRLLDRHEDTLLNPTVVVEVLSPSTEQYDRGRKFQKYRTLESLREYILVAQDVERIEHYVRQEDGQWLFSDALGSEAVVELPSIQCRLPLNEVYDKVTFEDADASPPSA